MTTVGTTILMNVCVLETFDACVEEITLPPDEGASSMLASDEAAVSRAISAAVSADCARRCAALIVSYSACSGISFAAFSSRRA